MTAVMNGAGGTEFAHTNPGLVSIFVSNTLALNSISVNNSVVVHGRALAQTDVTLDNDTPPNPAARPLPTPSRGLSPSARGLSEFRCNRVWVGHWLLGNSRSSNMMAKALSAGFQRTAHRCLPRPVGSRDLITR